MRTESPFLDEAPVNHDEERSVRMARTAVIMPPNSAMIEGRGAIETWLKALPVVITDADREAVEVDGAGILPMSAAPTR